MTNTKNKEKYSHLSHIHCWNNKNNPCGIPLEKHTQCCLCDMEKPKEEEWSKDITNTELGQDLKEMLDDLPKEEDFAELDKKFDELYERTLGAGYESVEGLGKTEEHDKVYEDFKHFLHQAIREERISIANQEIQYWKDVFDKRPERTRPVMRDADDVAQDFARIEIEKWENIINKINPK